MIQSYNVMRAKGKRHLKLCCPHTLLSFWIYVFIYFHGRTKALFQLGVAEAPHFSVIVVIVVLEGSWGGFGLGFGLDNILPHVPEACSVLKEKKNGCRGLHV